MKRLINYDLEQWRQSPIRTPLLIRGARQVGKTHSVRELGKKFPQFLEINFEKQPEMGQLFDKDLDPKRIINSLIAISKQSLTPGETLLFFDETQACPKVITALRYFYEEMPELHVIAAGSLLDFAIEKVGVPVGRVSYCYMYPVSFMEYLAASGNTKLIEMVLSQSITQAMDDFIHSHLFELLGEYTLIGGMPAVIAEWLKGKNLANSVIQQHSIINAYRDDFPKYAKTLQIKYVESIFKNIPHMITEQFQFSHVNEEYRKRELEPALHLLVKAGIVHQVFQTSGHGFPLGAEADLKKFKMLFLDVALTQAMLGTDTQEWLLNPRIGFANKGALTEALVGQELISYSRDYTKYTLHYWHRAKNSSNAEIDYLIQLGNHIIPIEVKSGAGSTLKSLQLFLGENRPNSPYGVRFSTQNYSIIDKLHSYPLYAIAGLLVQHDEVLKKRISTLL